MKDLNFTNFIDATIAWLNGAAIEYQCPASRLWKPLDSLSKYTTITPRFRKDLSYRLAPARIFIGKVQISPPMRKAPAIYEKVWVVDLTLPENAYWTIWLSEPDQLLLLEKGLLHNTQEKALAHANAIIKSTKPGELETHRVDLIVQRAPSSLTSQD